MEEQSPASSQQIPIPTSETPFVNPISAEESLAGTDKKSESADLPQQTGIDLPEAKKLATKARSDEVATGVTLPKPSESYCSDKDAQAILELTKTLQTQLEKKRM